MRKSVRVALAAATVVMLGLTGSSCDLGSATTASRSFEGAKEDPTLLRAFLTQFPKGADLHNHLVGAIYAEEIISIAARANQCFNPQTQTIINPPCPAGTRPVRQALTDRTFNDQIIDALSIRHFVAEQSPDDDSVYSQFFATFGRFNAALSDASLAQQLVAAKTIAARDNVSYVEYMVTPRGAQVAQLGQQVGLQRTFHQTARALRRAGVNQQVAAIRTLMNQADAQANRAGNCQTPQQAPQCQVRTSYLYQVVRDLPPSQVFAQFAVGFALARNDSRFVGINLVGAENGPVALRDYDLHMQMVKFFNSSDSHVKVALHAGELTQGLVEPTVLGTHIAKAMDAGAERIGHGSDLAYVQNPNELLAQLKQRGTTIETLLTTDEQVLGLSGQDHPFGTYKAAGVNLVLGSDDQGVSRDDLTNQYLQAVQNYNLSYDDLVRLSRQSLESSFLPGASLWTDGVGSSVISACSVEASKPTSATASVMPGTTNSSSASASPTNKSDCETFTSVSAKAAAQLQFEQRLSAFNTEIGNIYTQRPSSPSSSGS